MAVILQEYNMNFSLNLKFGQNSAHEGIYILPPRENYLTKAVFI